VTTSHQFTRASRGKLRDEGRLAVSVPDRKRASEREFVGRSGVCGGQECDALRPHLVSELGITGEWAGFTGPAPGVVAAGGDSGLGCGGEVDGGACCLARGALERSGQGEEQPECAGGVAAEVGADEPGVGGVGGDPDAVGTAGQFGGEDRGEQLGGLVGGGVLEVGAGGQSLHVDGFDAGVHRGGCRDDPGRCRSGQQGP